MFRDGRNLLLSVGALADPGTIRIHEHAPVTSRGAKQADLEDSVATLEAWINLWRSLILSSLGETYQPYCHFVRVLDFRDLRQLLEQLDEEKHNRRRKKEDHRAQFFQGRVNDFFFAAKGAAGRTTTLKMQVTATLEQIGDQLTMDTPMLEELMADVSSDALQRWIPRLRHLREVRCWDGSTIEDTGESLAQSCPHFRKNPLSAAAAYRVYLLTSISIGSLELFNWVAEDADTGLARFLQGLRQDTLQHVKIFSRSTISTEVAAALGNHKHSLTSMDIGQPQSRTFLTHLPNIEQCTHLTTLKLDSIPGVLEPPAAEAMSKFLQRCTRLRDLSMINTLNAPAILTPLLASRDTHLERLQVERYNAGDGAGTGAEDPANAINVFHSALTHQAGSLRALVLNSEGESCDAHRFAAAASELVGLTELRAMGVSDYFVTEDILLLCSKLRQLEELAVSGWAIENKVWTQADGFRALPCLRRLDFFAFAAPNFEALHDYIQDLRVEKQWGMTLNM